MITKDEGQWWVECDECGDCDDLDVDSFAEAVQAVKDAGWRVIAVDGEWKHVCTDH